MNILTSVALASAFLVTYVAAHSWLSCADYTAELSDEVQDFDYANCEGYIRGHWDSNKPESFSLGIRKYTEVNQDDGSFTCQFELTNPIQDGYTEEYHYATYTPGSTYRLAWPAKNHAIGEECGETSSTDRGMKIFVNPNVNSTSDLATLDEHTLVWDWHEESGEEFTNGKGIKGIPFPNCMAYCDDTDASPCWGDMVLPDDNDLFSKSGFYTFLWYWDFGTQYVSCFDVWVNVDGEIETVEPVTGSGSDSEDSSSSSSNDEYHVLSPICYQGADYNEDLIIDTFETLFSAVGAEFEIVSYSESTDDTRKGFNFSIETYTTDVGVVNPGIRNGTACMRLIEAFGNDKHNCSECQGGTSVNLVKENNDEGGDGFIIALVVVLVIVFIIIAAGIGYSKFTEKNNGNSKNASGMAEHQRVTSTTTTQANIVHADGPNHGGTTH